MRRPFLIVASTVFLLTTLAGCVAAPNATRPRPSLTPIATAKPHTAASEPLASGIVDTVLVTVYAAPTLRARHGCGCSLPGDAHQELFPAGTPVAMFRVTLEGEWKPSQGDSTTQDATGTSVSATTFAGWPYPAVLDTNDGPVAAKAASTPWLPSGAFGSGAWAVPDNGTVSFMAGWYVPRGTDVLNIAVRIPSEGATNTLQVPVPEAALKALRQDAVS